MISARRSTATRAPARVVKRALRCGVDVIYHCESADAEALDMLEAKKDESSSVRRSA